MDEVRHLDTVAHPEEDTKDRKLGQEMVNLFQALKEGRLQFREDFPNVDSTICSSLYILPGGIAQTGIRNERTWASVNIDRLQHWIETGRITCSKEHPITARELLLSGCIHDVHDGIKLLAGVKDIYLLRMID